jgi:predicted ATPase/DNA-binding SARP family transcriptional activator/Tfp pilus assembly protein PilF
MDDAPQLLLWGAPAWGHGGSLVFAPERRYQLLALLAVKRGEWVSRNEIGSLLWPDHATAQARSNLRNVLFKARAVPGAASVQANDHALRWDVPTDLQAFDLAMAQGRLGDAVDMRRGLLLEGLDDSRNDALAAWLRVERERQDARWRQVALDCAASMSDASARVALAERLLRVDPLDEAALAVLIDAEHARGNAARAQQVYRAFARRLAEDLGVEPSHRLRDRLTAGGAAALAPDAHGMSRPADLPAKPFVGRKAERAELASLLGSPDGRLVTILGPGGIGKSSLAQQAAATAGAAMPGGAIWVDLQDLGDMPAVGMRLASLLGVTLVESRDTLAQLALALQPNRTLVVFDNAEHLVDLPAWIDRLLEAAPTVCVLATSRVRLHSAHEQVLVLAGLPVPDDDSRDVEAAGSYDSVRLFDVRATAAQRGFDLARHLDAVIDCVQAVAGLPLAIELAASWVRLLPPAEIARDLQGSIALLERDPSHPHAPVRPEHHSVRAVLEGSWQRLSPAEQQGLAALSVFRGGFGAGAARAVAGVPISLLSSLADKSLVTVDEGGRFGLHPLVQAYAADQLQADRDRAKAVSLRHAEHFAHLVASLVRSHAADQQPLVAGIEAEFSNVRAAWQQAVAHDLPERVAMMAPGLRTYFHTRGRMAEGVAQLAPALSLPDRGPASTTALAHVQHALASLHYHRRDLTDSARFAQAGLASAERCHDRRLQFGCLATFGACHSTSGRWQQAAPLFEKALSIAQADGERSEIARALADLGVIAKKDGALDLALERYNQALDINRELGRHDAAARCLNNIGVLWMERDAWAQARDVMRDGLALSERQGIDSLLPYFQNGLGLALFELGELDEAERHLERALQRSRAAEVLSVELLCNCLMARISTRRGRHAEAEARFRVAAGMARQHEDVADLLDIALYYAECQRDRGRRLDAARTWAVVTSHPNAEAGIRASAARWTEALALDAGERAELAGSPTTLDAVVDQLLASGRDAGDAPGKR